MGRSIDSLVDSLDHIDVDIHASHLNYINGNDMYYRFEAAANGSTSWTTPYPKPQLTHHAHKDDAIGRIIAYDVLTTTDDINEPNNVIKLTSRIVAKDAMKKILTGIYYTCSVGSRITKIRCSECNQVLTEEGLCEHEKGDILENGNKVYWIVDEITYTENSFVNKPADPYARIVAIDIGNGVIPYKEFLDHRATLINELNMEDSLMDLNDGKLSASARKKLPDSAFCGPGRSFPAHDKSHVIAGSRLLDKSTFSDSTKTKIKSCLYRKGKPYGITPSKDELEQYPNMLTFRIDDEFSDEEVSTIAAYFEKNPDADLPEVEDTDQAPSEEPNNVESFDEIKNKDKDAIIAYTEKLISTHTDAVSELKKTIADNSKKINTLEKTITDKDTIINSKDDEASKYLDEVARTEEKYRQSLIGNIVDLQTLSEEKLNEDELKEKYNKRQIHSLVDTISDLHSEINNKLKETNKVDDPTLQDNEDNKENNKVTKDGKELPDGVDPKLAPFYHKNWRNE